LCQLEKYGTFRIDPCLVKTIEEINTRGNFRTLASCCVHGKYRHTIVVIDRKTNIVCDYYTGGYLSKGKRKGNRYYKKDSEGYYFIPEVKRPFFNFRAEISPD